MVEEILAIEGQLTRVQTEIDSLEGRLKHLLGQVEMASIRLTVKAKRVLGPEAGARAGSTESRPPGVPTTTVLWRARLRRAAPRGTARGGAGPRAPSRPRKPADLTQAGVPVYWPWMASALSTSHPQKEPCRD